MASATTNALCLLFATGFILAMASPSLSCPVVYCENETSLRLYLHRIDAKDQTTAAEGNSSKPGEFGKIVVNDWAIVDAPTPGATVVARGEGIQVKASPASSGWFNYITIVFQDARFTESTIVAIGSIEWAIVGGTGQFANAHGTIKLKLLQSTPTESFIQLDIHVFSNPDVVSCYCNRLRPATDDSVKASVCRLPNPYG